MPGQTAETEPVELQWFKWTRRTKKSYSVDHIEKSAPRLFALTKETTLMDIKRLILEKMRGIFENEPEDDEELNNMIEVHVRENLPMVKKGAYTRTKADCEFCGEKHSFRDEYCDLKINDEEVNASVESSQAVKLGQIYDAMKYERRLILAIILKPSGEKNFAFNELRCRYKAVKENGGSDDEDNGRSQKALTLASCFAGYSTEETLSGDDQWYCNICKEHRDITKKLEIYSVPKIFII